MDAAARIFIDYSTRKLSQLTDRIESCLDRLTEEQVWSRGGENENAVGNLALHLAGNVRQWIVSGVGGAADTRERDAEFNTRGDATIPELKRRLRAAVEDAVAVLEKLPVERLTERVTVQKYDVTVLEAIYHVVEHFSLHNGQILFATKMLTGGDLGFHTHLKTTAAHVEKTP